MTSEPKAPMGVEEAKGAIGALVHKYGDNSDYEAWQDLLAALAQPKEGQGGHTAVADGHGLAPDVAARFSDEVVERMARDASADADLAAALLEGLEALANTPMNIDLSVWSRFAFNVQNVAKRLRAALATIPPPSGPGREAVARIIEPHGWGVFDYHGDINGGREAIYAKNQSLLKADAILALLASPSKASPNPQEAEGWKPINTAPKDGTHFIGRGPAPAGGDIEARETHWCFYGKGSLSRAAFDRGEGPSGAWRWSEPIHNWSSSWNPTHWRSLDWDVADPADKWPPQGAVDALIHGQRQIDMDGVEIAVSRQALDEVLAFFVPKEPT